MPGFSTYVYNCTTVLYIPYVQNSEDLMLAARYLLEGNTVNV